MAGIQLKNPRSKLNKPTKTKPMKCKKCGAQTDMPFHTCHATVKIGEFTVPLIGIKEDATQQECVKCKRSFHLSDITLNDQGEPHCKECIQQTNQTNENQ